MKDKLAVAFLRSDEWKEENGDLNRILMVLWLLILRQLPQNSFFNLRLACKAFKALVDNPYFVWEPPTVSGLTNKAPIPFNLGAPRTGGTYYYADQRGEYRWPGGQLCLCRDQDHVIELKSLRLEDKGTTISCQFNGELVGHKTRVTVLRPLSANLLGSGDESGQVLIWTETESGFEKQALVNSERPQHTTEISAITRSNIGHFFTADKSGKLICWYYSNTPSWEVLWEKKLLFPIVSLKIISDEELEVICMVPEKTLYSTSIYALSDGEKKRDEKDYLFGSFFSENKFMQYSSFFNGNRVEFRTDEYDIGEGFGVTRSVLVNNIDALTQSPVSSIFQYSAEASEQLENATSVFSNGNLLFWRPNGDAKVIYHKRLPLTAVKAQTSEQSEASVDAGASPLNI